MTRATELLKEVVNTKYLVVMKPRRIIPEADFSGAGLPADTFKATFTFGRIVQVRINTDADNTITNFTEVATSTVAIDEFFFDITTNELFIGITSGDLTLSNIIVIYEIYVATFENHFNRIPTDNTSDIVFFEPKVIIEPQIQSSIEDILFGLLPVQSGSIQLSNADHFFERHVFDSSFNNANIDIFHVVGDLKTENIKKVIAMIGKNIVYQDRTITINLLDRIDLLDNKRPINLFDKDEFPDIDPGFINKPIRTVFGRVRGVTAVNVDFNDEAPSTTNNRRWNLTQGISGLSPLTLTVDSGAHTTTKTFVTSTIGARTNDNVLFDRVSGTDQSLFITNVDVGGGFIEHEALLSPMTAGDSVLISFVGSVQILQGGKRFFPRFGTIPSGNDFSVGLDGPNDISGILFKDGFEGALGMATLSPSDEVTALVYGTRDLPQVSGGDFGSVETTTAEAGTGPLFRTVNPATIIIGLLKELNIPDSDINIPSFTTVEAATPFTVGFMTPFSVDGEAETFRDIITRILQSCFLRLFINASGLWTLKEVGTLGAADFVLQDDELVPRDNLSYSFDYEDIITTMKIKRDIAENAYASRPGFTTAFLDITQIKVTSDAINLHDLRTEKIIETVIFEPTQGSTLVNRFAAALSERRGLFSIQTQRRLFDAEIDDVIEINRDKLPGFEFIRDNLRTRKFRLIETAKSLKSVVLTLEDQKGIEDNPGDF